MAIELLKIPERSYGQPIPVAPDTNAEVAKINELVAAVNAGLATSNAIVGGDKYVQYTSSGTYGVPAEALTLDRLDAATILPGTTATVINPADTPLTATAPSVRYVATLVDASTAGAVQVPAYTGATTSVWIAWQLITSADSFTPYLASELAPGKKDYAGLALRPALLKVINALNTNVTTVTTPADVNAPKAPTSGLVDDEANTFSGVLVPGYLSLADYEVFGVPSLTGVVSAASAGCDIQSGRLILRGLTGALAVGTVGMRVAASGIRPAGASLTNKDAFTGAAVVVPPTTTPPTTTPKGYQATYTDTYPAAA